MPNENNGNEYYATGQYRKNNRNEEFYAKRNGEEFYLDNNGIESMAERLGENDKFVPYFAEDKNKLPICPILEADQTSLNVNLPYPKNLQNRELYPVRGGREYYINSRYAANENGEPYYARDGSGFEYYASGKDANGHTVQFPITDASNAKRYIQDDKTFLYPLNLTKNIPIYSTTAKGKEEYVEKDNVQIYGCNKEKLPVYAKDGNSADYFASRNGKPYYAFYEKDGNRYQYYPKLKNKNEFYLKEGRKEIYARFRKDERYARTKDAKEVLAADENNVPYYATDGEERELYPTANGATFYRKEDNVEKIAFDKKNKTGFYAKNSNNEEFYPKSFNPEPNVEAEINKYSFYREPTMDEIKAHM